MAYAIQDLLNDLSGVVHGTKINKVPNVYGIINRAARAVLLDVDPKETQRIVQLGQVFNDVFDYALPVDVKGDKIIDLRVQAGRMPSQVFTQGYAQNFDANKLLGIANKIYTQWNSGVKSLRIEAPTITAPTTITDTSTTTGWSVTTGAANLSLDTTNNVAGGGALQFDLEAGSTTGSIEISSLVPLDLSADVGINTQFYWVYLPTGASITSIELRWGSDYTANYYSYTSTTNQQGTSFVNGWNLIAAPWASATKVGTPVDTSYDSVQVIFTYNGDLQTGVKFCSLTSNPGYIFEIQYYSKFLFRNPVNNGFVEKVTEEESTYLINFDTESYNLLFNKCAYYIAQSLQGADAEYDADYWQTEYNVALARYKGQNPSESMLKGEKYYNVVKKGYTRYASRFRR